MTPFLENIVRGAASVTLVPTANYNAQRISTRYEREARLRGVPFDNALIRKVSREHFTGAILFAVVCLACVGAAVALTSRSEIVASAFAAGPAVLFLSVFLLERQLPS